MQVRVARKTHEAIDICSLELVNPAGGALPAFSAGAHIDVHAPGGLVRQYSLYNDPAESHRYLIGTLKDPKSRGGSLAIHDQLQVGDLVQVGLPRNNFALVPDAQHVVLLAGGIGITPLLCMATQLAREERSFEFHYCARSRDRAAFYEQIRAAQYAARVQFHFDDGEPDQKLKLDEVLGQPDAGKHLYACGPTGFLNHVRENAQQSGWPQSVVHFESFGAVALECPGDSSFEVKIASTGTTYQIPANISVVTALAAQGVHIAVSCEQGICGTCLTGVLDGAPDHRDAYLTNEERERNDSFLPCCSRARSALLTLDL